MNAIRPKNIQIEYPFFLDLISYASLHEDLNDPTYHRIVTAFHKKLEAMERHDLYSLYKSGASEDIRQNARKEYLNMLGIRNAFRWYNSQDVNVTRDPDALLSLPCDERGANHEKKKENL